MKKYIHLLLASSCLLASCSLETADWLSETFCERVTTCSSLKTLGYESADDCINQFKASTSKRSECMQQYEKLKNAEIKLDCDIFNEIEKDQSSQALQKQLSNEYEEYNACLNEHYSSQLGSENEDSCSAPFVWNSEKKACEEACNFTDGRCTNTAKGLISQNCINGFLSEKMCTQDEECQFSSSSNQSSCAPKSSNTNPTSICTDNATQCDANGTSVMKCRNNEWFNMAPCPSGQCATDKTGSFCLESECDASSASTCDENHIKKECQDGRWVTTGCCDGYIESDAGCEAVEECDEGEKQCQNNNLLICVNGAWKSQSCEVNNMICHNDECVMKCSANADCRSGYSCNDGVCIKSECNESIPCTTGFCDNGRCVECKSGEYKCEANTVRENIAYNCVDGQWQTEDCTSNQRYCQVSESVNKAYCTCIAAANRCSDDASTLYVCKLEDKYSYSLNWFESKSCELGCITSGNKSYCAECEGDKIQCKDAQTEVKCEKGQKKSQACSKSQTCVENVGCKSTSICGNGIVEADEQCDGKVPENSCALAYNACEGTKFSGTASCTSDCSFDGSSCKIVDAITGCKLSVISTRDSVSINVDVNVSGQPDVNGYLFCDDLKANPFDLVLNNTPNISVREMTASCEYETSYKYNMRGVTSFSPSSSNLGCFFYVSRSQPEDGFFCTSDNRLISLDDVSSLRNVAIYTP